MRGGSVVVLAGPDGAGKSSLAAELESHVNGDRAVLRLHHRPRVLPSREAARRPTETPHRVTPYPRWLAAAKVVYLAFDFGLGWLTRVRPAKRRGDLVVLERGWWDLVVDPLRYRLSGVDRLTRALSYVLPRPRLTVILDADPGVLFARKPELSLEELARQQSAWRNVSGSVGETLVLDATLPVEELSAEVVERLSGSAAPPARSDARFWNRLVRLNVGGRTTWLVPSDRRSVARSGLSIYHPMSRRSRLAWEAARVLAGAGVFRLLPASETEAAFDVVAAYVPPGGAAAIAHGRRDDRYVALVIDRSGSPAYLAKVALDEVGRASLHSEVDALHEFGPLLTPPLAAPRVVREEEGVVLFQAIDWVARRHPWVLSEEVAGSLGSFHSQFIDGRPAGYPVHGDFTPWNLLRTKDGWVVVDWEEATLRPHGFDDPLHYVLQGNGHLGAPSSRAILRAVHGLGDLGRAFLAYARAADLPPGSMPAALEEFLERTIPRLHVSNPAERRSLRSRRRMLGILRASAGGRGR